MKTPTRISTLACIFALSISMPAFTHAASSLKDVAIPELGATAQGTKSFFNRDWPADRALKNDKRGAGTIFNPFEGATIDIRLVIPVEIAAVEITGLDYANTRQVNGVDIYIDDRKVTSADLPDAPGQPTRIVLPGSPVSQHVRIVATGGHPNRVDKNGKTGPDWGGFRKIAVLSPVDLAEKLRPVDDYIISDDTVFVAPTAQSMAKPSVEVQGQPRQSEGHPRTLWDKQDVIQLRAKLKTSPTLAEQYKALKQAMDTRLALAPEVPQPIKDDAGNWIHLPTKIYAKTHTELSLLISNLGTIYALSGESKYADYAGKLLLAYADVYDKYIPGNRPGFTHDKGKCFDQRLGDAIWLIPIARGYDLVYNGLSPSDRLKIEDDLLKASANFIAENSHVLRGPTNWSAICTTAVLITGYATDDQALIDLAMYGPKGSAEKPTGGVILHFSDKTIGPDGLWSEGAMGYQFMAMQSVIADAEILWRNGIDMYRYRDGALKKLFDSAIAYAYPDLKTPAIHDSSSVSIVGRESYLYEYGWLRYRDPRYILILDDPTVSPQLDTRYQQFPVSVLFDREASAETPPVEWKSENFNDVGYGILRNTSETGTTSLLIDYGPNRSHGHPDKLNVDLWNSRTGIIAPDPGIVWYEKPLYRNWFRTTLAHNTLSVDERDQLPADGTLLVYGGGDTLAAQRANAREAAPGVLMDRSLFLTREYVADIFGAFARLPRKLDLAWHLLGDFSTDLPLTPFELPEPREAGYSELADTQSAKTDAAWSAIFNLKDTPVRFIAAGGAPTEVITGDGWFGRVRPKTIIQRRQTADTVYGNIIDLSGEATPFVQSSKFAGSLAQGYAALVIETTKGRDTCIVTYRTGEYTLDGVRTDALQAFVRREGDRVTSAILGGGRILSAPGLSIILNHPGLVLLEHAENGSYVLSNPSDSSVEVALDFAPLHSMQAYSLDAAGYRQGQPQGPRATYALAAGQRIEFAAPGKPGVRESRDAMLRKRQAEQEATLKVEFEAAAARSATRVKAAAAAPAPSGTSIVVQAEDFTGQGEGEVAVADNKTAQIGNSLAAWNGEGHWLEWEFTVPTDGYYNLSLVYCTQPNNSEREIVTNGTVQEPYAPFRLPTTGGYSNGTDDWRLFTAQDPITESALLVQLKAGSNTLRLVNTNGLAANIDYIVVSSPDVKPTRIAAPQ